MTFVQVPPEIAADKHKRKAANYSQFPLTAHGELMFGLIKSNISSFPHVAVRSQFFETVGRYLEFFRVRTDCIMPVLEALVDERYVRLVLSMSPGDSRTLIRWKGDASTQKEPTGSRLLHFPPVHKPGSRRSRSSHHPFDTWGYSRPLGARPRTPNPRYRFPLFFVSWFFANTRPGCGRDP